MVLINSSSSEAPARKGNYDSNKSLNHDVLEMGRLKDGNPKNLTIAQIETRKQLDSNVGIRGSRRSQRGDYLQRVKTARLRRIKDLFWEGDDMYNDEDQSAPLAGSSGKSYKNSIGTGFHFGQRLHLNKIHDSPHIYTIDNFLTEKELEHLEKKISCAAKSRMFHKSFVDGGSDVEKRKGWSQVFHKKPEPKMSSSRHNKSTSQRHSSHNIGQCIIEIPGNAAAGDILQINLPETTDEKYLPLLPERKSQKKTLVVKVPPSAFPAKETMDRNTETKTSKPRYLRVMMPDTPSISFTKGMKDYKSGARASQQKLCRNSVHKSDPRHNQENTMEDVDTRSSLLNEDMKDFKPDSTLSQPVLSRKLLWEKESPYIQEDDGKESVDTPSMPLSTAINGNRAHSTSSQHIFTVNCTRGKKSSCNQEDDAEKIVDESFMPLDKEMKANFLDSTSIQPILSGKCFLENNPRYIQVEDAEEKMDRTRTTRDVTDYIPDSSVPQQLLSGKRIRRKNPRYFNEQDSKENADTLSKPVTKDMKGDNTDSAIQQAMLTGQCIAEKESLCIQDGDAKINVDTTSMPLYTYMKDDKPDSTVSQSISCGKRVRKKNPRYFQDEDIEENVDTWSKRLTKDINDCKADSAMRHLNVFQKGLRKKNPRSTHEEDAKVYINNPSTPPSVDNSHHELDSTEIRPILSGKRTPYIQEQDIKDNIDTSTIHIVREMKGDEPDSAASQAVFSEKRIRPSNPRNIQENDASEISEKGMSKESTPERSYSKNIRKKNPSYFQEDDAKKIAEEDALDENCTGKTHLPGGNGKDVTSCLPEAREQRTSSFIHFSKLADSKIAGIENRAAELLSIPIHCVEPLQLVRYTEGQYFMDHHDMGVLYEDGSVGLPVKSSFSPPRRLVTILVYLNNLPHKECGGATYFPLLKPQRGIWDKCSENRSKGDGFYIYPKRAMAVVWCNIDKDGMPDPRTVHSGQPLIDTSDNYSGKEHINIATSFPMGDENLKNGMTAIHSTVASGSLSTSLSESKLERKSVEKYVMNIWACEE